jgi:hypothetical protein
LRRIRIRLNVKRIIRIGTEMMRIRNPGYVLYSRRAHRSVGIQI